jgi:hypothetical protein
MEPSGYMTGHRVLMEIIRIEQTLVTKGSERFSGSVPR